MADVQFFRLLEYPKLIVPERKDISKSAASQQALTTLYALESVAHRTLMRVDLMAS